MVLWKGTASQFAEKPSFVSGYRFSDTARPSESDAPLGAGCRIPTLSANCSAVPLVAAMTRASAPEVQSRRPLRLLMRPVLLCVDFVVAGMQTFAEAAEGSAFQCA